MTESTSTSVWDVATFVCGPVYDCVTARHGVLSDGKLAKACIAAASAHDVKAYKEHALALSAVLIARSEELRAEHGASGVPVALIAVSQSLVRTLATMTTNGSSEADVGFAAEIAVLLSSGGVVTAPIRFVADGTSILRAMEATALLDTPAT